MSAESLVQPGDVIAGKYEVERFLGAGGMGVVVAARHVQLGNRVAIKVLHPEAMRSAEVIVRFEREARAAVRLQSDHAVRVFDVGKLESGAPYMILEFLEGEDLGEVLARRGPLPVAGAVQCVLQACDALIEAHGLGIVHRDIKPANLFVAKRPNGASIVKVLDFGIAKESGPTASAGLTSTSALMGSPLYMSPEQLRQAKAVDARADQWALGVTLYELVSGALPFNSESMPELCSFILTRPPEPLRSRCPDVPPALEAIVLRCLEKEPSARFATLVDLAAALEPFAGADVVPSSNMLGAVFRPRAPSLAGTGEIQAMGVTATSDKKALGRVPKAVLAAAGAALLVVAMSGVWLLTGRHAATPAAPVAAESSLTAPTTPLVVRPAPPRSSIPASAPPRASASPSASAPPRASASPSAVTLPASPVAHASATQRTASRAPRRIRAKPTRGAPPAETAKKATAAANVDPFKNLSSLQ